MIHKFELWGVEGTTKLEKACLYWGWTNGFLQARGKRAVHFADCLESITSDQAVAMIDKQYKDHPERWSNPLGEEILEALTVDGSPCEGKSPLTLEAK